MGDNKHKLTEPLIFFLVIIFGKYPEHTNMIVVETKQYSYHKEDNGATEGKLWEVKMKEQRRNFSW